MSPSIRNEDQTLWLMDMLKGHRFFSKLEPAVVKELCKQLELRTLTKGDVLFQQGAEGKVFYIILSGQISLHSTITSDRDVLPPMVSSSSSPSTHSALLQGRRSAWPCQMTTCRVVSVVVLTLSV